jgi:hypothetical protein
MTGWGVLLVILGIGSFVLPMIGLQFRLMDVVEDYQPYAGIVVAAIGAVLIYLGMQRRSAAVTEPERAAMSPQAPAASPPPAAGPIDAPEPAAPTTTAPPRAPPTASPTTDEPGEDRPA